MNELLAEEKAERYNKILQAAKARYNTFTNFEEDEIIKHFIETLFPEITWSNEEEKVRNGIIALIYFALEDKSAIAPGHNVTKEEAITWLERQGKPKWTEEDNQILDKIVNSLMGAENVDCADYNVMYNWLISIKQKME